jgi:hypothetical protein
MIFLTRCAMTSFLTDQITCFGFVGLTSDDVTSMIHSIVSVLDERVASVLPKSRNEFESLFSFMDALDDEPIGEYPPQEIIDEALAYSTTEPRNVTWLQEHGMCLDNLIPAKSTIEQAGYGAFARRHITEGSMIIPMPLLVLANRSALNMYKLTRDDKDELTHLDESVVGTQLLLNYCFSHDESSVVVCPATNVILANHCSTRREWGGSCGNKGPNAEVRWGYWDETTEPWLNSTIEELTEKLTRNERGLSMELIALRDIGPDEEVTIDYGIEWENAFLEHSANWEPPEVGSSFENYVSVQKLIEEHASFPFRTLEEQDDEPYPDNAQTMCYKLYDEHDDPVEISELTDEDILLFRDEASEEEAEHVEYFGYRNEDYIDEIDSYAPNQIVTDGSDNIDERNTSESGWFWPCHILSRNGDNSYTVRILHSTSDNEIGWRNMRYARLLYNYPGQSIKFANKRYKSDQFLPGAFRHHIGLNDKMFPDKWKHFTIN